MTRVLPRFPTAVRGINALSATTQNGVLEVGIDPTNLAQSADPTAPGNYTFILKSTTNEFELAEVASTIVDIATKDEAEAGTDNTAILTPLRAAQEIEANVFPTRAELLTRDLPAVQTRVRTSGYATPGVGGAEYFLVGSEPAHAGKFQTPDGRWWEIAAGATPAMLGAVFDGTSNDSAALSRFESVSPGGPADLKGGVALVTAAPHAARYANGSFKVGSELVSLPAVPRIHPFSGSITSEPPAPGSKWPAGPWYDPTTRKLWRTEVVGERHDTTTGASITARYSDDSGETWLGLRTIWPVADETRVRGAAIGLMSNGRYGGVATTGPDGSYKNFFVYSDDAGATWAASEITFGLAIPGFVFGMLMPGPSGAPGDFIIAGYGSPTPGAKLFRTQDNGATWNCTLLKDSTGLPGMAQEPSIVHAPGVGWVMFVRTSANANVWAATSPDLTTWSAWVDCGANLGANPVHALYDGGSIHLMVSERDGFPGTTRPNEIYCYSVPAREVYANPAAIGKRAPTRIAALASRAVGYMQSCRLARSVNDVHAPWHHDLKVGEGQTTARGTRSTLVSIRDMGGAAAKGVAEVVQLVDNPIFSQWPRGTTFSSFTTDRGLAGRWHSVCSGATLTVEQIALTADQRVRFPFRPLYGMRITNTGAPDNYSGFTQRWEGGDAINIARTIQRSGELVCRIYGMGAFPAGLRAGLSVNGVAYATGNFARVPSSQTSSWVAEARVLNTAVPADLSAVTYATFTVDNGATSSEFDYTVTGLFLYPADCARNMEFNEPTNTVERVALYCRNLSSPGLAIASGVAFSATNAVCWMPVTMAMAGAASTISSPSDFNIVTAGGAVACSNLAIVASTTQIQFTATVAGATPGVASLQLGASAVLRIDSGY